MITTAQAVRTLEHREGCGRQDIRTTREQSGRVVTVCRSCGAQVWHDQPLAPRRRPTPTVAPIRPGYACRDHLTPVTWKGTGCRQCAAEARERRRARHRPSTTAPREEWEQ